MTGCSPIILQSTYTAEDIERITQEFLCMMRTLKSERTHYGDVINECDKAFSDVYHYCELQQPKDHGSKTKVTNLLHDIGIVRRQAKDLEYLTETLVTLPNKTYDEVAKAINEVNKRYQKTFDSQRYYQPRVLSELFN